MSLSTAGRLLLILGLGISLVGGLLWATAKLNLPLGRLPGDFRFQLQGISCFVPLATSLLLSLVLSVLVNLILRILNR